MSVSLVNTEFCPAPVPWLRPFLRAFNGGSAPRLAAASRSARRRRVHYCAQVPRSWNDMGTLGGKEGDDKDKGSSYQHNYLSN